MNKIQAWVKKNPRAAAAAGFAAIFLFIKKKGGSGGGAAVIDGSQAAILPVATSPNESVGGGSLSPDGTGDALPPEPPATPDPIAPEPAQPADTTSPTPAETAAESGNGNASAATTDPVGQDPAPVRADVSGISIAGKDFPGATSRQQVGSGRNQYGSYTIWLVSWPNKSERWWHYYKDESGKSMQKWTGPHNSTTGNSGGPKTPAPQQASRPTPSPTPAPAPAPVPAPAPGPPLTPTQANPGNWITTVYTNSNGHKVRVYGDGHKEVYINGVWKRV
jgi:hypothetical protein